MKEDTGFYLIFSIFLIALCLSMTCCGCGETEQSCEPPTGTYLRTYTPEYSTGTCSAFDSDEPQSTRQLFVDGEPYSDDCTVTAEDLTDDQCNLRFHVECDGSLAPTYTDVVSRHDGGATLEGERSIVLSFGDETCESTGTVRYEAL